MNEGMLIVREEREADFDAIRQVVMEAFASAEHSDGDEHALVERLRQTDDYIPALSLVAEWGDEVVGHIMFSSGIMLLPVCPSLINGHRRSLMRLVRVLPGLQAWTWLRWEYRVYWFISS